MSKSNTIEKKKITTGEFRVSFPHVFEPQTFKDGEPKYGITMLFPKNADLKAMKRAAEFAAIEKFGKEKYEQLKARKKLAWPFRDGGVEFPDMDGYPGHIFVTATSKAKNGRPGLIDKKKNPITDPSEFYAGCYARATLIAFAYDADGTKFGVSFALQNIQKTKEGKPFSGRKSAEDEFDEIEDDETDVDTDSESDESDDDMGF